jgi:hypothetical protein
VYDHEITDLNFLGEEHEADIPPRPAYIDGGDKIVYVDDF